METYIGFKKLAAEKGPALAAYIGRKKYGAKGMHDSKSEHKKEDASGHITKEDLNGSRYANNEHENQINRDSDHYVPLFHSIMRAKGYKKDSSRQSALM